MLLAEYQNTFDMLLAEYQNAAICVLILGNKFYFKNKLFQ